MTTTFPASWVHGGLHSRPLASRGRWWILQGGVRKLLENDRFPFARTSFQEPPSPPGQSRTDEDRLCQNPSTPWKNKRFREAASTTLCVPCKVRTPQSAAAAAHTGGHASFPKVRCLGTGPGNVGNRCYHDSIGSSGANDTLELPHNPVAERF